MLIEKNQCGAMGLEKTAPNNNNSNNTKKRTNQTDDNESNFQLGKLKSRNNKMKTPANQPARQPTQIKTTIFHWI